MDSPLDPSRPLGSSDPRLLCEFVEHLMRLTDDETLLLAPISAPDLFSLRAALGSILPSLATAIPGGSPVAVVLGYGALDPNWRSSVEPVSMSLWEELGLMRSLGLTSPAPDPLTELLSARA